MDSRFNTAQLAIHGADVEAFETIVTGEPELASGRSSCSHPTLMQCLVLDGVEHPPKVQLAMAKTLLQRGSPIDEPLIAAASVGNVILGGYLLDNGASIDGRTSLHGGWTPLEESLYWGFPAMTALLLERGAAIPNLRTAAGLGRVEAMMPFFDDSGAARVDCGGIRSPFGSLEEDKGGDLAQQILDNAVAYAAMGGHGEATALLLARGASANSFPLGFHYRGTALHWAAIRGHREVCELLIEAGADTSREDLTVRSTPAVWARHGNHDDLAKYLEQHASGLPTIQAD